MSAQPIIQALEKLIRLHKGLLESATEKTEMIKSGSVDQLQKLLTKEHKYVQALQQAEMKRQNAVKAWQEREGLAWHQPTITAILDTLADEHQAAELENRAVKLTRTITQLKRQEKLNQDLLRQSMQFIELSLAAINPSLSQMNYGHTNASRVPGQSVFDSKV